MQHNQITFKDIPCKYHPDQVIKYKEDISSSKRMLLCDKCIESKCKSLKESQVEPLNLDSLPMEYCDTNKSENMCQLFNENLKSETKTTSNEFHLIENLEKHIEQEKL